VDLTVREDPLMASPVATALERVKDLAVGAISAKGVELFAALCATVGSTGRAADWASPRRGPPST